MKRESAAWCSPLLVQLKELHNGVYAGPEYGKSTFIRMIGASEEDNIPQELVAFVYRIRMLCAAYRLFDEDGGGTIDSLEFGATMTKLFGWRPTKYETEKMMAMAVGIHHDVVTEIDWDGFIKMMTMRHSGAVADKLTEIVVAIESFSTSFECFEVNQSRTCCCLDFTVPPEDFCQVWTATGMRFTADQFKMMLSNLEARDAEIRGMAQRKEACQGDVFEIDFACFVNILTDPQKSAEKKSLDLVFRELKLIFEILGNREGSQTLDRSCSETVLFKDVAIFITNLCGCDSATASNTIRTLLATINAENYDQLPFSFFVKTIAGCDLDLQDLIWQRMGELREVYNLFDLNDSGMVDLDGFIEVLQRFGGLKPDKVGAFKERFDIDGNGMLDFIEFTEMMLSGDERIISVMTEHIEMLNEVYTIIEAQSVSSTSAFSQALVIVGGLTKLEADAIATAAWCNSKELDKNSFLKLMFEMNVNQQCRKFKRYLNDLRQSFLIFDTGDGECVIGHQELKVTFQLLGFELNDNHINDIIESNQVETDVVMTFGAYVALTLPLVLRFRADVFKEQVDLQSQVNQLREQFASVSTDHRVPVFNNRAELDELMSGPSSDWPDDLAQHVMRFLLSGCGNEALRRLDPSTQLELCRDVRLLRAAPQTCITEEGKLSQHMLVVLRGAITVYLPPTSLAGTERHEMWGTVRQLLGQIVPRLQLTLSNWPSTPSLPSRLYARTKYVEKTVRECIQDANNILHDGDTVQLCTEYVDIWTKPSIIQKGARLLAKLLALMDSSCECREQCTKVRTLLIARPQMQERKGMATIANTVDCIGDMLTELMIWKTPLEATFGELQDEKIKKMQDGFVPPEHLREVGSVIQGQAFGIQSLTSVYPGMDFEPALSHDTSQLPLAVAGHAGDESGTLVLAFSRSRLISILAREPGDLLRAQKCFSYLRYEHSTLERLAMACIPGKYHFGETMVHSGTPADCVIMLAKGQIKVVRHEPKLKHNDNSRETISVITAPSTIDTTRKDSLGKMIQDYTFVADSANVDVWWIKRGLFADMAKEGSKSTDSTALRNNFYSDQIKLIQGNSEMLEKTAAGQNEKLSFEVEARKDMTTNEDDLSPPYGTKPSFELGSVLQGVYSQCIEQSSVSKTGKLADAVNKRDFKLHLLDLVVHPFLNPKVPMTARPDLTHVDPSRKIITPLPQSRRRKLRHTGFQVGLEDSLVGMSSLRTMRVKNPTLPSIAKRQVPTSESRKIVSGFIKGFVDKNMRGSISTTKHNSAVQKIADKLRDVERRIVTSTGTMLFDCSVAKLKHELNTMLHPATKSPRLPSMVKKAKTEAKATNKVSKAFSLSTAFITAIEFEDVKTSIPKQPQTAR